jgi:Flp pilus assembly protein TadB
LFVGPLLWLTGWGLAGVSLPVLVPVWLALAGAAVGVVIPRAILKGEAVKARSDFRHALGAYLDVLVLLLAAQEGPESAMEIAARAGNGPAFMDIRRATNTARLSGEAVWGGLDELGRRVGVGELCEVAAAGLLAGERGVAVRRSLTAKARALRSSTLMAAESSARSRTQAMFVPVVLMGCGFIMFLLFPLLSNISVGQ